MSKLDDAIEKALNDEDEQLLKHFDTEPGYVKQAFGMFRGQLGWVMWVTFISSLLFFIFSLYAVLKFTVAQDILVTVKWGIAAVMSLQMSVFLRGFMGAHFEANRLIREFRKLELRLFAEKG